MGVIKGATIHINYRSFGYKAVAHMLAFVDPSQAEQAVAYLQKMPEVYSVYGHGPRGNLDITISFKSLRELDRIKDSIRNHFSVSEIKTAIWTDVKEMHWNMSITPDAVKAHKIHSQVLTSKAETLRKVNIDETDRKIADMLAEDGRRPIESIAKEAQISVDTARRRYEKLKKNGVLKVTIQFDPTQIGYAALGVFFAVTSNATLSSLIDRISEIPDVISIMKTTGDYDLQIYALIKDIEQLLSIQAALARIQGLSKIDSEILPTLKIWPTPRQYISTF